MAKSSFSTSFVLSDHRGASRDLVWATFAPPDHVVHIYDSEDGFVEMLRDFVIAGLSNDEGVVVIATPEHLDALDQRLSAAGFDLRSERYKGRYFALDAKATLGQFMMRGWPNDILFKSAITNVLDRAGHSTRRVRAFGEMVALLWEEQYSAAAIRLEALWHQMCHSAGFSLFCAYARHVFKPGDSMTFKQVCTMHTEVIEGRLQ